MTPIITTNGPRNPIAKASRRSAGRQRSAACRKVASRYGHNTKPKHTIGASSHRSGGARCASGPAAAGVLQEPSSSIASPSSTLADQTTTADSRQRCRACRATASTTAPISTAGWPARTGNPAAPSAMADSTKRWKATVTTEKRPTARACCRRRLAGESGRLRTVPIAAAPRQLGTRNTASDHQP
ncbi:MAG: hypothetical protein KatS3mg103_0467 [Phycisphaerales bacterium]|nr:MAG: hypothetical protein KatS3mg103_0467 [Phycisphaerales bacterium]